MYSHIIRANAERPFVQQANAKRPYYLSPTHQAAALSINGFIFPIISTVWPGVRQQTRPLP